MKDAQILLYYKYIHIENPTEIMDWQRSLCSELGLKGRIIIANEGINGTLEGTTENTEKYIVAMNNHPLFGDIHWKKSEGTGNAFPRLSVKVRNEIVSLHLGGEDFNPADFTANHLNPAELQQWYDEDKEFYVVDMRNDYELEVGKFDKTVFPGLENFRDLSKKLDTISDLKDKTVVTVCTGGVRCEKASGYLLKKGFKDVHQLNGGMVSYMKEFPGKHFRGSLYTFDNRTTMTFDKPEEHDTIGRCHGCKQPSENYGNCGYILCNKHMIVCPGCIHKKHYCGLKCRLGKIFLPVTRLAQKMKRKFGKKK